MLLIWLALPCQINLKNKFDFKTFDGVNCSKKYFDKNEPTHTYFVEHRTVTEKYWIDSCRLTVSLQRRRIGERKKNWSRDLKMSNSFGSCNLTYAATYEIKFSWTFFRAANSRSSLNERIIFSLCLLPLNKMREVMAENYFLCEK